MKRILFFSLFLFLIIAQINAKTEKVQLQGKEIELVFENITLNNLTFHKHDFAEIKSGSKDVLEIRNEKELLSIQAPAKTKISLILPDDKSYLLRSSEKGICCFDKDYLIISGEQGEQIEYKNGILTIQSDEGREKVEIGKDGIFVVSDDEKVEISARGIIVEDKDEDESTNLTGFWGRLLGKSIRSLVNISLSAYAKDSAGLVKQFVNDNYSFSFTDYSGGKFESDFHSTYQGKEDLTIHVENNNGSISIEPWNEDFVEVQATIQAERDESDLEKVEIAIWGSKSGDVCHVETKELEKSIQVAVNYSIQVPEKVKIGSIKTVSGNITIEDLNGNMELNTTNGNINVEDCKGIVTAKTMNGNINCEEIVSIETIKTTNGNINIEIDSIQSKTNVSTTNGSISLTFLQPVDAELDVSTKLGEINTKDFTFSQYHDMNNHFTAVLGKGGNKLILNTTVGNVNLKAKNTNTKE